METPGLIVEQATAAAAAAAAAPATATAAAHVKYADFVPELLGANGPYEPLGSVLARAAAWLGEHGTAVALLGLCTVPIDLTNGLTPDADLNERKDLGRYRVSWTSDLSMKEKRRYSVYQVVRLFYGGGQRVEYKDFLPERLASFVFEQDAYETVGMVLNRAADWAAAVRPA
eukprot:TRINITY_DN420_c0_g1_i1.p2 TRINITY_DN420_c0_g1~~TRINITY_DN420_c0_g1_i1.p2  ORF type:complete len:190 (+),score=57.84 TRINITY_DN420_c0_g1_i1:57-572(+)